ncbi:TPA: hypothetical protein ACIDTA_004076, partial [Shigella flexneri]|nr:hypothetical protein [Shigella sonnei]EHE6269886.1 hypothetical protein [Shigella flexneri]EIN9315873.1 hypothetical protein [Shigella flexneri]EIO0707838.1 hypothetical protein [Shigella flexneri]EIS5188837.1 hypothetical protein [Shigella flexneri]
VTTSLSKVLKNINKD